MLSILCDRTMRRVARKAKHAWWTSASSSKARRHTQTYSSHSNPYPHLARHRIFKKLPPRILGLGSEQHSTEYRLPTYFHVVDEYLGC